MSQFPNYNLKNYKKICTKIIIFTGYNNNIEKQTIPHPLAFSKGQLLQEHVDHREKDTIRNKKVNIDKLDRNRSSEESYHFGGAQSN